MATSLNQGTLDLTESRGSRIPAIIGHLCAVGVAGFFLYAAIGKVLDVRLFALEVSNYKMWFMDPRYVRIPAILLPWVEIAAAIALLIPSTRKGGALLICGMLLFFIYAVHDAAILRGLDIRCGCTGKDSGPAGWLTIYRNIGLIAATLVSVYLPMWGRRRSTVDASVPAAAEVPAA